MGAWTAVVIVATGIVGVWPTRALAGDGGAVAMAAGLVVAVLGAWVSQLVTLAMSRGGPQHVAVAALAGLGARFVMTFGLAVVVLFARALPTDTFLLWVGIGQTVALGVDVWSLTRIAPLMVGEAKC